jgi:hypothetical protein
MWLNRTSKVFGQIYPWLFDKLSFQNYREIFIHITSTYIHGRFFIHLMALLKIHKNVNVNYGPNRLIQLYAGGAWTRSRWSTAPRTSSPTGATCFVSVPRSCTNISILWFIYLFYLVDSLALWVNHGVVLNISILWFFRLLLVYYIPSTCIDTLMHSLNMCIEIN